jgi:hypothetical protein
MKFLSRASVILALIFSLVCSPIWAAISQDKSNLELKMQLNAKQEGILVGQVTKERKGFAKRWFKRKNTTQKKRQGFFGRFFQRQQRRPKVQQKQKRQGFLSRFRLKQNRKQQPRNQKRGFLRGFGTGRS